MLPPAVTAGHLRFETWARPIAANGLVDGVGSLIWDRQAVVAGRLAQRQRQQVNQLFRCQRFVRAGMAPVKLEVVGEAPPKKASK